LGPEVLDQHLDAGRAENRELTGLRARHGGDQGRDQHDTPPRPPRRGHRQALNFGMTSVANQRSCSSMTACGVPMLLLTLTWRSPGKRDWRSWRYATSSSGGPANQAPVF